MSKPERWLSTEEFARQVGMSPDWVRRQIEAGRLPARIWDVGQRRTIRIRQSDADAFIRRFSRERRGQPY
jgi:excisionase family DNA binding protein